MRRRALLLTLLPLLPGCASRRDLSLDPRLFPQPLAPPDSPAPGRIAVLLQPTVKNQMHEGEGPTAAVRIPIGRIVEKAMQDGAVEVFAGGVQHLDDMADAGPHLDATLVVQSARVAYHQRLLWVVPLPIVGAVADYDFDTRLALDITLLDQQGRAVWTRIYDDGQQIWKHDWLEQGKAVQGLLRLTHEAAWRLSRQAVRDVREWVEAERMRPRML
jgi:hypothetical protein